MAEDAVSVENWKKKFKKELCTEFQMFSPQWLPVASAKDEVSSPTNQTLLFTLQKNDEDSQASAQSEKRRKSL